MRTLSWKHTLGLVTMDVELADRTLSVAVTPVQAVVLLYFQDQGERLHLGWPNAVGRVGRTWAAPSRQGLGLTGQRWGLALPAHHAWPPARPPAASWTLEALSKAVKMPAALLRRRVAVWLQQGVLREEPAGTFSVVEEERPQDRDNLVLIDSDDESDSGMASQADQKEEELLVRGPGWVAGAAEGGAQAAG